MYNGIKFLIFTFCLVFLNINVYAESINKIDGYNVIISDSGDKTIIIGGKYNKDLKGGESYIIENGIKDNNTYGAIRSFTLSLSGYSFLNYKENGAIELIHNGEKIINVRQFLYSPNGESFSYIQSINKKLYVVTDGKIGSFGFDVIKNLSYSGDGKKVSYAGQNYSEANKMHIIENDKELFLSNWLVTKLFYNDENDLYVENMSKESFINGKKQDNLYYEIYENSLGKGGLYKYKFFSNKKDLSDIDRHNGKKIIIENGVEYGPFDGLGEFIRNKYGKLAFVGIENGNYYLFYNGEKKGPFKHLYNLKFSKNGNNFAFVTCNQDINNFYKEKKECYIIKDGENYSKIYSNIRELTFSPNGEKVAYKATDYNNKSFVVIDKIEGTKYNEVANITFSPDSKHLAYYSMNELGDSIILDGKNTGYFNGLNWSSANIKFLSDSSKMYFIVENYDYTFDYISNIIEVNLDSFLGKNIPNDIKLKLDKISNKINNLNIYKRNSYKKQIENLKKSTNGLKNEMLNYLELLIK